MYIFLPLLFRFSFQNRFFSKNILFSILLVGLSLSAQINSKKPYLFSFILMKKTIFNVQERLETYSEERSKILWFKPVVLGIMITETIDPKSWFCEKMIKGASIVLPVMPEPDYIEFERKSLNSISIDPSFYALITNEFEYHSANHEVEIHWILIFTNRPKFQEEFNEHEEKIVTKIYTGEDLNEKDDELAYFHFSVTNCNKNPIDYRFEYMEGLEIIVPEGELPERYLLNGKTCESYGGIK